MKRFYVHVEQVEMEPDGEIVTLQSWVLNETDSLEESNRAYAAISSSMDDPLFIWACPTGIVYSDRRNQEVNNDYKRVGCLSYQTLELTLEPDVPADLKARIVQHASVFQAARGMPFAVDQCGHSVVLGG